MMLSAFLTQWALFMTMVFVAHKCYVQHSPTRRQSQSQMRLSASLLELALPLSIHACFAYWVLLHRANMARPIVMASPLEQFMAYANHIVSFLTMLYHTQASRYQLFAWNGIKYWLVSVLYLSNLLF